VQSVITILAVCLLCVTTQAQTANSVVVVGSTYDQPGAMFATSVGGGLKLGPVWAFGVGKFADPTAGSLDMEVVVFKKLAGHFLVGLVAGPNADWQREDMAGAWTSYLTSAGGALIGYHKDKVGVYFGGKYKIAFKDNVAFRDGYRVGVWLAINP